MINHDRGEKPSFTQLVEQLTEGPKSEPLRAHAHPEIARLIESGLGFDPNATVGRQRTTSRPLESGYTEEIVVNSLNQTGRGLLSEFLPHVPLHMVSVELRSDRAVMQRTGEAFSQVAQLTMFFTGRGELIGENLALQPTYDDAFANAITASWVRWGHELSGLGSDADGVEISIRPDWSDLIDQSLASLARG